MGDIENKLKALFDYQRFENNKALDQIINQSKERNVSANIFALDEISLSFAAGGQKEELPVRQSNKILENLDKENKQ